MIIASALGRHHLLGSERIDAVKGVDLHVQRGQNVAIIGRSGSGKSTLLNLLAGLDRPSTGTLSVNGRSLEKSTRHEMVQYRLTTVGVIFQAFQLIAHRTAMQNVEMPLILRGVSPAERRELAEHWLERVGLTPRRHHLPYQLSGGEQQRVAVARALVNDPQVILADEPTGNLDSCTAAEIIDRLMALCNDGGKTSVIVTHDRTIADSCSQRQFEMVDGQLTELKHDEND